MINEDIKNIIKKNLGIYLEETGRNTGGLFTCLNPAHEDNHPSMSYDPKRNIVKCFSCNTIYDIISLYALDNNLDEKKDFRRIIEELAKKYKIDLENYKSKKNYGVNNYKQVENKEDFSKYINKCKKELEKEPLEAINYLVKRGITEDLVKKYNIGYDKERKLIIFPISNTCYLGRSVEQNAYIKHVKPKGVSNEIFNNKYLKESNFNSVIWVTEGIIDALSLEATNNDIKAISLNSINNTKQLIDEASKYNYKGAFILALDTDTYGLEASNNLSEDLETLGIKAFIFNSSSEKYNITTTFKDIVDGEQLEQEEKYYTDLENDTNKFKIEDFEKEDYIRFRVLLTLEEEYKNKIIEKDVIEGLENLIKEELRDIKKEDRTPFKDKYNSLLNKKITIKNKDINEYYLEGEEILKNNVDYFNNTIKDALTKQANKIYEQENVFNYLDEFNEYVLDEERTKALSTGIDIIDEALDGGFNRKNLIILGAISSMGKTTLALQIADNIAKQKEDVLIFSLEMSKEELIAKSLSKLSFLNTYPKSSTYLAFSTKDVMKGKGVRENIPNNKKRIELYKEVLEEYKENIAKNVYISECNENLELNVKMIDEKIKKHIAITGRKPFVIVDYLQIIKSEVKGTDTQIIASIVTDLKRIARNNDTTIFLISAFNRNSYSQEADLASFRDSSTIEYTSDILLSLQPRILDGQTGDQKGKSTNKKKVNNEQKKENRELTLKVLKNRNGRITDIKGITFYAKYNYMSFKNATFNND